MYFGAKFYYKQPPKKAEEMDFVTDIAEIEAEEYVIWILRHLIKLTFRLDTMNLLPETRLKHSGNG